MCVRWSVNCLHTSGNRECPGNAIVQVGFRKIQLFAAPPSQPFPQLICSLLAVSGDKSRVYNVAVKAVNFPPGGPLFEPLRISLQAGMGCRAHVSPIRRNQHRHAWFGRNWCFWGRSPSSPPFTRAKGPMPIPLANRTCAYISIKCL